MARLIPAGGGGLPVGVPLHLPIAGLPKNCVLLDGSAMPAWASTLVKTMYGASLPDYRGRVPTGTDEGSGRVAVPWAQTPGQGGGEERHVISSSEMPSHDHAASTNTTGNHGHSGSATAAGNHRHSANANQGGGSSQEFGSGDVDSPTHSTEYTNYDGNHSHSLSVNANGSHAHTVSVGNRGGGSAANIMQPGIAGRWVMRLK